MSKVNCKECNNDVVPRLWHEDMYSWISYRKNQHMCPICGVTMYETGGGTTPFGIVIYSIITSVVVWWSFVFFWNYLAGFTKETSKTLAWTSYFIVTSVYVSTKILDLTVRQLLSKIVIMIRRIKI